MRKLKIKIFVISILMFYLTIRFFSTPFYFIDFPCFYEVNNGILKTDFLQSDSVKDLIVLISVFPEHASGGGCFDKSVLKNEEVNCFGHSIKLSDTNLLIDKNVIKDGDSIQINKIHIKPTNIWWIYHSEFKLINYGQIYGICVNDSLTKSEQPSYCVAGYNSQKESFNFVTAMIYIGLFIYLTLLIKKLIKNKKAHTADI